MVVQARSAAHFYFRCNISITGLLRLQRPAVGRTAAFSPGIAELLLAELNRLDPHLLDKLRVG
jgi:hypothetical protein